MICFNCGNILTNSDYCSHCGMDVSIYKRIVKLSNAYYNAGLIKAQNRDLSGAVDALNRCIKLNKRQIDARNLLGLVYFEMGETVQAFREWVVSLHIQGDNNGAEKYLEAIQADKNKMDELNHTIRKFNVALAYAQNGTEDMAVIQLKKILTQNPNLVKGHQLLALLYLKQGEYERAKKSIMKALKIDKCNALSTNYLREINKCIDDERKNNPEERNRRRRANRGLILDREYLNGNDVIIPKNSFREAFSSAQTILHIALGLVLGACLVYFVVTPARISRSSELAADVKTDYEQKIAIKNSTISELQRQVDDMEQEKNNAEQDLEKYKGQSGSTADNYSNLLKAVEAYIDEEYTKSIEYLGKIDNSVKMNSKAFDSLLEKMNTELKDELAKTYFNNAKAAQNKGDIEECIEWYQKAIEADGSNDEAYYRLGWVYSQNGKTKKAQEMFQKIVNNFPGSKYYEDARKQVKDKDEDE
ncbi:MAG: tetratricopeptide repeat protein [Lachnospiraceae bacterium]|nr:tetratricopeptide repeat protein [Lachnospiraceae bacterium]